MSRTRHSCRSKGDLERVLVIANVLERVGLLTLKLAVITETARALTDIIDTERSLRLELIIVLLIVFEIIITFYEVLIGR